MKWSNSGLLLVVLAAATCLRVNALDSFPLWVDEAESSINALTILEHGVPIDHYLGLPVFENTLVQPWVESDEYEFRDSSYSRRGFAIYHGWLPLYAIAASLAVSGVDPDHPQGVPAIRHDARGRLRRTIAPRIPSVIFGVIGLIALYWAGLALGGTDVAWAALVAGAFAVPRIEIDDQARYYAATVAISTICCLTMWKVMSRPGWRNVVACALSLSLLFYTHLMTFFSHFVALALMGCAVFVWRRRAADLRWLAVLGLIIGCLTIPWLVATGFFEQRSLIPRAWPLLRFPADFVIYPASKLAYAMVFGIGLLMLLVLRYRPGSLPQRVTEPWRELSVPAVYLATFLFVGYFSFLYLIPAASLFWSRMSLSLMGPGFLLEAVFLTCVARMVSRNRSVHLAPFLVLLFLLLTGRLISQQTRENSIARWRDMNQLIAALGQRPFTQATRIFSSPNDHLTLTYLTGLPVQSIAPVRKSFLDKYPGEIVFVQRIDYLADADDPLGWPGVKDAAQEAGVTLSEEQSRTWSEAISTREYRMGLSKQVARVWPALEATPAWALTRLEAQSTARRLRADLVGRETGLTPIFHGYDIRSWDSWWPVFFYRFVNPDSRRGTRANYAERMHNADAVLIPRCTWVLLRSPGPIEANRAK